MFEFNFPSTASTAPTSCSSSDPWSTPAVFGTNYAFSTTVFSNVTNQNATAFSQPNKPALQPSSLQHETTTMLVKGDFLCASRLLELASSQRNPDGSYLTSLNATTISSVSDADSPSRDSTPMSVANAVLFGDDDSPSDRRAAPATSHHPVAQSAGQSATALSHLLSYDESSSTTLLQREYSCFSVSAGGAVAGSRDATPTSPTSMGLGAAFTTKMFPPPSQHAMHANAPAFHPQHSFSSQTMTMSPVLLQHGAVNGSVTSRSGSSPTCSTPSSTPHPLDPSARRAVRSHHVPTVVPVQKPVIVELTSPQTCVIVLEFKMGRRIRCRSSIDFSAPAYHSVNPIGQYFVTTVDNTGFEDCGLCVSVVPMHERQSLTRVFGHGDQGTVLRMANAADCDIINDVLPVMEEDALEKCHELIHFLHLPFVCVDAEYTFDKNGCKVFYSLAPQACTSNAPNVSRLQRELGFKLKCRVVLEQVRQSACVSPTANATV